MSDGTAIRLDSGWSACGLAAVAVGAFHLAYLHEEFAPLLVIYLGALFALAWVPTSRWAFYGGMAIGMAIAGPQLAFFWGIFGPAAVGLWAVLGVWFGLFLLLSHIAVTRWPRHGAWWIPVLWFALEYSRSELYYLRFAWLTPGFGLSHANWVSLAGFGVYGFSLAVLLIMAAVRAAASTKLRLAIVSLAFLAFWSLTALGRPQTSDPTGPYVVGIQLEGATEQQIVAALDGVARDHKQADLVVLSEYAFREFIPQSAVDWCKEHRKYLIAGCRDPLDGGTQYHNTAFVVAPDGEFVFRQVKAVPVQFMTDGLPATEQNVWNSPWGKIGIAICYDLSYARVIDRLIEAGAQGLIVPTMDSEDWGEHEHRLHAKVAPVRAREYGVPIFRLASSGISQLVSARGEVLASAPFPGQEERLAGNFPLRSPGRLPLDRHLALPAVIAVGGLLSYLARARVRSLTMDERGTDPSRIRPTNRQETSATTNSQGAESR